MRDDAFELGSTHLNLNGPAAELIPEGRGFWSLSQEEMNAKASGWLVATFDLTQDMQHWEMHPEGDEVLTMLAGVMQVVFEEPGNDRALEVAGGESCIVQRGVWHRQVVVQPGRLLSLTYGKGTQHRPR